jgi:hypothetical protein
MSSVPRALAAAATVLLSLAIVAVLVARLAGAPIAQGPLASPTQAPTASPHASAAPTPTPTPADEMAVLAGIEQQTRDLRGLPDPGIGAPDVITRAQLAGEVQQMLDDSWTPDELRRANLILQAMGLLTADQDLRALTAQLLEGQVLGFYEYTRQRMVVVSDAGLDPEAEVTYAHEYTHALQDGAFGAGAHLDSLADDDAIAAYQALVEGDATLLMFQWAFAHLSFEQLAQIGSTPLLDMTGIPDWMVQQLQWPYLAGLDFLSTVSGMSVVPGSGVQNWSAVDAVYANPPASTEQVIHPDKYRSGEEPTDVAAVDVAGALGAGWQDLEPNTVGEAMISIWLAQLGAGSTADAAAAGWGGDRQTVAVGPDGAWAMAWRVSWDTVADAQEFADAVGTLTVPTGTNATLLRPATDETVVLRASSPDLLATLEAALGG